MALLTSVRCLILVVSCVLVWFHASLAGEGDGERERERERRERTREFSNEYDAGVNTQCYIKLIRTFYFSGGVPPGPPLEKY